MITEAIVLAAGMGTRLKPITDHAPKCLTEVNGVPILVNTLENLSRNGIKCCTIVTGYLSDVIVGTIGDKYSSVAIEYIRNEQFEKTNDMYSLWLARHVLERGALILEGDIYFKHHTLSRSLKSMDSRSFYLSGKYNGKKSEILLITDDDFRIQSIRVLGKDEKGRPAPNHFMSTGILSIQSDYGIRFSGWLSDAVRANNTRVLFDSILSNHITELPLYVFEVGHDEWVEIDTPEDLAVAERVFG